LPRFEIIGRQPCLKALKNEIFPLYPRYGDWHSLVKGLKTTAEPGSFEATFNAIASAALASPPSRAASPPSSASIGVELKHALGLESACKGYEPSVRSLTPLLYQVLPGHLSFLSLSLYIYDVYRR
jgi:hypothetical protein